MDDMNIDWALLRSQKLTLIQVIGVSPPTVAEDLTGILHLIDAIQDEYEPDDEPPEQDPEPRYKALGDYTQDELKMKHWSDEV